MVFYSKNSNSKVIHKCNCAYYKKMSPKNVAQFNSISEARDAGYHLCKHCAPMWNYYSKEYNKMKEYASKNGLAFEYNDGVVMVQTPYSNWKIIVNGPKNNIFLYHKNTYERCPDRTALVPGYHSQSFRRNTLMEYLIYITEHDAYKLNHPEHQDKSGSKSHKKETKKQKKRARYQSMMRVFALLENEKNYRQMQMAK